MTTTESILVVGATGSVGSELIQQLAASGRRVKALIRDERKAGGIRHLAEPVFGDLMKPETLTSAFEGAERVYVLAPPTPDVETMEFNAFNAAVAGGAKHIVFQSNFGAGNFGHDDWHFVAHANNEHRLKSLNVEWTILRPTRFMNYTPYVWPSIFQRSLLLEGGGSDGKMTVIDPADIASIGLLALTTDGHFGQSYELTSEDFFSVQELAATLSQAVNRDLTIFNGDAAALRVALEESGAPGDYAPLMAGYFATVAAGHWRVTDTVERLLGRKPRSYAQWLERNLPGIVKTFQS